MAEAQITSSGLKSRLHRQHEPVKCEKHLKDTIEQLEQLTKLFLEIQTPSEKSGLHTQFIEYWDKFSTSLTKLLKQFESRLSTGSKNFDMETFSKYTFFFYHMAEEIKFLFPSGKFATNQVFGRKDAQNWWERNFNPRVAVASAEFLARFRNEFPDVNEDGDALIDTMGFSSLDYISKYDLDIFTRLFGAWPFVTRIWRRLVNHPGYQKYGTFNTTFDVLNRCRTTPGSYTFRISMSLNGYWSIGYVSAEGKITQVLCFTSPMTDYLCSGKEQGCGHGNQKLLQAAERVAAACGRDQDAIEVDLRILYEEGFGLDQVADALIAASGDRAKAKEFLKKA
ncbi:E3 ubiquitin-protein ligase CBL-C [Echinococcus granulosus]|nr:E3 ubiquitin-protein ligase CBL-C [Echinococcus granulosus]